MYIEVLKRKNLVRRAGWFSITHKTIQHDFWHTVRLSRRWDGWCAAQTLTPTATRTSSTSNATTMVCGWTTIGRNPTTSGIRTTSSCSVFETIFFSAASFTCRGFSFQGWQDFSSSRRTFCLFLRALPLHFRNARWKWACPPMPQRWETSMYPPPIYTP